MKGEMIMACQSRWGWHPCDYETYRLLKWLHACCVKARRDFAAWQRWRRKQPHNRVVREWIRDEQGRRIGSRVVGPRPEPPLCPIFCVRAHVISQSRQDRIGERVSFSSHGIREAYRAARTPLPSEEQVQPLSLTPEAIRRLAAQVEEVYGPVK
jgi:hypothetical protein